MNEQMKKCEKTAGKLADELESDVLFLKGSLNRQTWRAVSKTLSMTSNKRKNVLLVLVTPGGDPDAAFRIARCLQQAYDDRVFLFISGWCKSAGTLVTLSAQKLYIGDLGELGPLDIQVAKPDELFEMSSGLSVQAALETLEEVAGKMFINIMVNIRAQTGFSITTRTAAELSAAILGNLLAPIYRQIEPIKIGENQRAMKITKAYGQRLLLRSRALSDRRSLDILVSAYPDHGFVIDREEAASLFVNVEKPTPTMERLAQELGEWALHPKDGRGSPATVAFLSPEAVRSKSQPGKTAKEEPHGTDRVEKPGGTNSRRSTSGQSPRTADRGVEQSRRKRAGNGASAST